MNLILLRDEELQAQSDLACLEGSRARHVVEVLRAKPGKQVRVGRPRAWHGTAEVLEVKADRVLLGNLLPSKNAQGPMAKVSIKPPKVSLLVALPRPKALRRLLQTAACFGVDEITLTNAWKVDKSYWSSPVLEPQRMAEEVWIGCEQGGHTWLPRVDLARHFVPHMKGLFSKGTSSNAAFSRLLVAHPRPSEMLGDSPFLGATPPAMSAISAVSGLRTLLAVGPEGGWVDSELGTFSECGFRSFSISGSVLRSEIALAAALAQLEMQDRWNSI